MILVLLAAAPVTAGVITNPDITSLLLDFDSGVDDFGSSSGDLRFTGPGGFEVLFTDDNSAGTSPAYGVHITNTNPGNIQVGTSDLVLGTLDPSNTHSSGIVALFSRGAEAVQFFDSDDDSTLKTLFAFDQTGNLIGQSPASSQVTFSIDTSMTGGTAIWSVEFDTEIGSAGGFSDGTVFTIDDFCVDYLTVIPEPAQVSSAFAIVVLLLGVGRRSRKPGSPRC